MGNLCRGDGDLQSTDHEVNIQFVLPRTLVPAPLRSEGRLPSATCPRILGCAAETPG